MAVEQMAFGSDLQGWPAHKALLGLQDFEISLLETIKKCMSQRVKADRDYCNSLSELISVSLKLETSEISTPFSKAWQSIVDETQKFVTVLTENVSKLQTNILEKLQRVISDKKLLRKHYSDQRNRLDLEFYRLSDQVTKCKMDYEQRLEKLYQCRSKYEDMSRKGKVGVKLDEARNKFVDSVRRLHSAHNNYVLALSEFNLYQRQYHCILLPDSLSLQQLKLEQACAKCHDVLVEFASITTATSQQYQLMNTAIGSSVDRLKPDVEYSQFIAQHRAEPARFSNLEFQQSLLNQGLGTIDVPSVVVNDVTLESVKQMSLSFTEQLARSRMLSGSRRQELLSLEVRASSPGSPDSLKDRQELMKLKRELVELQCTEEKFATLLNLLNDPIIRLGTSKPPPVFNEASIDLSVPQSDSQTRWYRENSNYSTTSGISSEDKDSISAGQLLASNAQQTLSKIRSSLKKRIRHSRNLTRGDSSPPPQPPPSINDLRTNGVQAEPQSRPQRRGLHSELSASVDNMYDDDCVSLNEGRGGALEIGGVRKELSGAVSSCDLANSDDDTSGSSSVNQAGSTDGLELFVEEETWYHGLLPREEVQGLLCTEGDYLLRVSLDRRTGDRQYVLSVRHEGHKHFILQGSHETGWRIEGETFRSIQQLVRYHQINRLPLTRKSGAMIVRAVERFDWELMNHNIQLLQKIGAGQFGEVFQGVYKPSGEMVAVKTCKEALSEEMKRKFLSEGSILKQYDHINIVKFIGIAAHSQPVMIVMEYVPGGSLLVYLRKHGALLSERSMIQMCRDVAAGMAYLQTKQCLHRDLATRNCLVGEGIVIKISDFGMSREEGEYTMSRGQLKQIPIKWTSPEALNYGTYTSASDVWSFGILMWEVFALGSMPYPGLTNTQAKERVDEGYRMPPPDGCPSAVYDIMSECWELEPRDRPHFAKLYSQLQRLCNGSATGDGLMGSRDDLTAGPRDLTVGSRNVTHKSIGSRNGLMGSVNELMGSRTPPTASSRNIEGVKVLPDLPAIAASSHFSTGPVMAESGEFTAAPVAVASREFAAGPVLESPREFSVASSDFAVGPVAAARDFSISVAASGQPAASPAIRRSTASVAPPVAPKSTSLTTRSPVAATVARDIATAAAAAAAARSSKAASASAGAYADSVRFQTAAESEI